MRSGRRQQGARALAATACAALALAFGLTAPGTRAAEVAGVELADAIELDGVRLQLNGAGERTLYVVRTYVAALYVAQPSTHAHALLGQPGPRRLSMTMLAALSTEWVAERLIGAVRANMSDDAFAQLQPRLMRLVESFRVLDRLRKGDRLDIDAVGGTTRVSVDGGVLGVNVPGDDLFDALLRGFIGERPIDAELQQALLGRTASKADPGT